MRGEHVAAGGGREPVRQDPVRPFERGSPLLAKDVQEVGANADDDGPADLVPLTIGELGLKEKARVEDARRVQVMSMCLTTSGRPSARPFSSRCRDNSTQPFVPNFNTTRWFLRRRGRRQRLPDLLDDDIFSAGPRLGRGIRREHNDARACIGRARVAQVELLAPARPPLRAELVAILIAEAVDAVVVLQPPAQCGCKLSVFSPIANQGVIGLRTGPGYRISRHEPSHSSKSDAADFSKD